MSDTTCKHCGRDYVPLGNPSNTTTISTDELKALKDDAERLDSKTIIINTLDEFGEPISVYIVGINLREAIDKARNQ